MHRSSWLLCVALSLACKGGTEPPTDPKAVRAAEDAKPAVTAEKQPMAASGGRNEPSAAAVQDGPTIDHEVQDIDGKPVTLSDYRGKAMLIVNTASECGYTPQYEGLQQLHTKYKDRGLVVLGFPSNDFGGQEPGTNAEIKAFVEKEFGIQFPMFAKVATKGSEQAPIFRTLTTETPDGIRGEINWNFTKFVVSPSGKVVGRFDTKIDPLDPQLLQAIESVLPGADQGRG